MFDLAFGHQRLHGSGDLFDRKVRVHPVLVVQINDVGLQPLQRTFERLPDSRRLAVLHLFAIL